MMAMATMSMEEMHEGARQQYQIGQESKRVAPMLAEDEEQDDGGQRCGH
jgi:hypothetical protein